MKKIKIQKSIDHQVVEDYSIPVLFISMLEKLMPSAAINGLKDKGFDIQALIAAANGQGLYDETFEVVEHGHATMVNVRLCH